MLPFTCCRCQHVADPELNNTAIPSSTSFLGSIALAMESTRIIEKSPVRLLLDSPTLLSVNSGLLEEPSFSSFDPQTFVSTAASDQATGATTMLYAECESFEEPSLLSFERPISFPTETSDQVPVATGILIENSSREPSLLSFDPPTYLSTDVSDHVTGAAPVLSGTASALPSDIPQYAEPDSFWEPSLIQPVPRDITIDESPVEPEWEIVPGASERGRDQLFDKHGHAYNMEEIRKNGNVVWTCSQKTSSNCKGRVTQKGSIYERGPQNHTCSAKLGAVVAAKVRIATNSDAKRTRSFRQ